MRKELIPMNKALDLEFVDNDIRSFKLVANSGEEFDLLTNASIVLSDSTEHFLYDVKGLGYSYKLETMNIGGQLVMSDYEMEPQIIEGTIMFDSYSTYYNYLAFIAQFQNMETNVFNTENMINLEYKTVKFQGFEVRNQMKIIAQKAEVGEKDTDGLLYVPISYQTFSKTNRQLNAFSTGILNFEDNADRIFPLPSILNDIECEYLGLPAVQPDQYIITILNPTTEDIPLRFIFEGNFINPRYYIRGSKKQRGQIHETGSDDTRITIDSYTRQAYAKNGTNLNSSLAIEKENFISLKPGDNDIIIIFQDGSPNGKDCSLIIEAIIEN